jgi:hypothetical protein
MIFLCNYYAHNFFTFLFVSKIKNIKYQKYDLIEVDKPLCRRDNEAIPCLDSF